ncbi:MAG: hypothetical protein AAF530_24605, partial [Pseudomonadota bacterium]
MNGNGSNTGENSGSVGKTWNFALKKLGTKPRLKFTLIIAAMFLLVSMFIPFSIIVDEKRNQDTAIELLEDNADPKLRLYDQVVWEAPLGKWAWIYLQSKFSDEEIDIGFVAPSRVKLEFVVADKATENAVFKDKEPLKDAITGSKNFVSFIQPANIENFLTEIRELEQKVGRTELKIADENLVNIDYWTTQSILGEEIFLNFIDREKGLDVSASYSKKHGNVSSLLDFSFTVGEAYHAIQLINEEFQLFSYSIYKPSIVDSFFSEGPKDNAFAIGSFSAVPLRQFCGETEAPGKHPIHESFSIAATTTNEKTKKNSHEDFVVLLVRPKSFRPNGLTGAINFFYRTFQLSNIDTSNIQLAHQTLNVYEVFGSQVRLFEDDLLKRIADCSLSSKDADCEKSLSANELYKKIREAQLTNKADIVVYLSAELEISGVDGVASSIGAGNFGSIAFLTKDGVNKQSTLMHEVAHLLGTSHEVSQNRKTNDRNIANRGHLIHVPICYRSFFYDSGPAISLEDFGLRNCAYNTENDWGALGAELKSLLASAGWDWNTQFNLRSTHRIRSKPAFGTVSVSGDSQAIRIPLFSTKDRLDDDHPCAKSLSEYGMYQPDFGNSRFSNAKYIVEQKLPEIAKLSKKHIPPTKDSPDPDLDVSVDPASVNPDVAPSDGSVDIAENSDPDPDVSVDPASVNPDVAPSDGSVDIAENSDPDLDVSVDPASV